MLNYHLISLYSAPSDDGKAYFVKLVSGFGLLIAECACLALPLDQANSKLPHKTTINKIHTKLFQHF